MPLGGQHAAHRIARGLNSDSVQRVAQSGGEASHFDGEGSGERVQQGRGQESHAVGPPPWSLVLVEALAERRKGVGYLRADVFVAQDNPLDAGAEAAGVGRLQFEFRWNGAARGQLDTDRLAVEDEG